MHDNNDNDHDNQITPAPERINVNELHELHDWAERLRVTADRLREIVKRVGDRPDDVVHYLKTANG